MSTSAKMRDATRIQAEGTRYVVCEVAGDAFLRAVGYARSFADAEMRAVGLAFSTQRPAAFADRLTIDTENPEWVRYMPDGTGRRWRPGPVQIDWTQAP